MARRDARTPNQAPAPAATALTEFDQTFPGVVEESRQFSRYYRQAAELAREPFIEAGSSIACGKIGGIPSDADGRRALGEALAAEARRLIG